jgi:hypothetical protein
MECYGIHGVRSFPLAKLSASTVFSIQFRPRKSAHRKADLQDTFHKNPPPEGFDNQIQVILAIG